MSLVLLFCSNEGNNVIFSIEGPWPAVSKAIHDCHAAVHALGECLSLSLLCEQSPLMLCVGTPRIATDIRIGTRIDKQIAPGTGNEGKVQRVVDILARDNK